MAHAAVLLAATDAAVLRDADEIEPARDDLVAAMGDAAARRAFATAGNFQMMNRLLDGLGVGPHERFHSMAPLLGVEIPTHFAS